MPITDQTAEITIRKKWKLVEHREIELSALKAQCLGRPIPAIHSISEELTEWNFARNEDSIGVK